MGSLLVDAFVLLVFFLIMIYYTLRGFVAALVGFLRFWIAASLAVFFSGRLSARIQPIIEARLNIEDDGSFFSALLEKVVSSGTLSKAIAFVLLFALASIAVKLFELLFKAMEKVPFVKLVNRLFGMMMGMVVGYFWVQILAFAMVTFADYLNAWLTFLPEGSIRNTVLLNWLYENNIFRWIVERLMTALIH